MKKVLICDDDIGIVEVTKIVLEEKGYKVLSVIDSRKIFDIIDNDKPDIILLDLWMPNLSGEEVVKKLKSSNKYKDIPVVIFSASKNVEDVAKQAGATGFLTKPFNLDEIEETVKEYCY